MSLQPDIPLTNLDQSPNTGNLSVNPPSYGIEPCGTIFPQGGEDPPPEFTPYEAECFESFSGDLVSHDKHLNEDGEALYRFLLSQGAKLPEYRLVCTGTHTELRTRYQPGGGTQTHTETVTDFRFSIGLTQHVVAGPMHWSIADSEPAYRGLMVRQVLSPEGKRKTTRAENVGFDDWTAVRTARGLPPWVGREGGTHDPEVALKSSRTVREWADEYCASKKYLKEFIYKKEVYGWDLVYLKAAVEAIIRRTGYRHRINTQFVLTSSKIYIRPDNALSRALSKLWVKILLWLFLIYPFIWLFKRFHSRGGGRWKVCGSAYALKYWQRVGAETGAVDYQPVGLREQDWLQWNEEFITTAVINRIRNY